MAKVKKTRHDGWDDPDLAEYIEESVMNENKNLKDMSDTDLIATLDHLKTGPANIRDLSDKLIKNIEKEIKRRGYKF